MKLGVVATIGLVLLGVAGMLAWTHFDQAARLKTGTWTRVQANVLQVIEARAPRGGIAVLRWTDAGGKSQDGGAYVSSDDFKTGRYKRGDSVQAWVHPGFARPELGDSEPNLEPDQSFTGVSAVACLVLGLGLLGLAGATGRVVHRR